MISELDAAIVRALLPPRAETAHKGAFGHLFVLAGSRGFTGAARLVCMAAYRSGTGLVTIGVPHTLADIVAAALVETMSLPLPATDTETFAAEALEPALAFAGDKQAVVIGPGLSRHPETTVFVHGLVRRCAVPLLVDADGLNAVSERPAALEERTTPCVLTPHPGEMARLIGCDTRVVQADREGVACDFAVKRRCVVVLKGHRTVVASPDGEVMRNPTGNSGMATGGSGDVLSGVIGGLMAQGLAPFDAALAGVYAHGLAGDIAADRMTPRALIASDIIEALPEAWRRLESGS